MKTRLMILIMVAGVIAAACGGTDATPTPTATPIPTATPTQAVTEPTPTQSVTEPMPTAAVTEPTPTPSGEETTEIAEIRNSAFPDITVQVGTTVTWINRDPVAHTTTSGTPFKVYRSVGQPRVGSRRKLQSYLSQRSGIYPIFAEFHKTRMLATISIVEDIKSK